MTYPLTVLIWFNRKRCWETEELCWETGERALVKRLNSEKPFFSPRTKMLPFRICNGHERLVVSRRIVEAPSQ